MKDIMLFEPVAGESARLQSLIMKNVGDASVVAYTDIASAQEEIKTANEDFGIFLLAITLPDDEGYALAVWLRSIPKYAHAWIVFLANDDRCIGQAVNEVHCYSYIVRPFADEQLIAIVEQLTHLHITQSEGPQYITVNKKGMNCKVDVDDILYIETIQKDVNIHTTENVIHISRCSLKKITGQLPAGQFMQCHRSFVINRNMAQAYESKNKNVLLTLVNGENIPVGATYREEVCSLMSNLTK